jgi:hypothetical protein
MEGFSLMKISVLLDLLNRLGWRQVTSPRSGMLTFEGVLDDLGQPLQIVLPDTSHAPDVKRRVQDALDTLIAAHGEEAVNRAKQDRPQVTLQLVRLPKSDLIYGGLVQ